jgi:hypothetical protein
MSIRHMGQAELAERWGVSQRTLERWRWLGFGPRYIKVGGRVVYRVDEIEAFEERQTRQSTSDRIDAVPTQGAGR